MSKILEAVKQRFDGDPTRKMLLILSTVIFVIAGGFVIYTQVGLAPWKEANIVSDVDTGRGCSISRANSGTYHIFTYQVDGQQYEHRDCINVRNRGSLAKVISYNPANPSESLFNSVYIHQAIAIAVAALGLTVALGSLFASNTRKTKN